MEHRCLIKVTPKARSQGHTVMAILLGMQQSMEPALKMLEAGY
jgi:hypothetical protein